jgi:hypothetical protein
MRLAHLPLLFTFLSCAQGSEQMEPAAGLPGTRYTPIAETLVHERTDSSTLHFKGGMRFRTSLCELGYIGQVQRHDGLPWLLLSGRPCGEAEAGIALYVHSPTDGPLFTEFGVNARHHPGRLVDAGSGEAWYTARTFYGEVLAETGGVIWYERIVHGDGTAQEVTTLLDLDGPVPVEHQFMDQDRLPRTLELMARGRCMEIPGIDQTAAP